MEVPSILRGVLKLKLMQARNQVKVLRLKGKGVPHINSYSRGRFTREYLIVWTPQNLSTEEKKQLGELRESDNFKPRPGKNDKSLF